MTKGGETWFVGADVCAVLDHSNSRVALSPLDDDEKGVSDVYTLGGNQKMNVVNESGLYALIFTSQKAEAKVFRRWITSVVIPSVRRTGLFKINATAQPEVKQLAWTVGIPGPGRYVVNARSGDDVKIHQTEYTETMAELTAVDCRIMACTCLQVASFWRKVQELRAIGIDPTGGFALRQLDRAILSGADLGRQYFYTYDKPDQPSPDDPGSSCAPFAG